MSAVSIDSRRIFALLACCCVAALALCFTACGNTGKRSVRMDAKSDSQDAEADSAHSAAGGFPDGAVVSPDGRFAYVLKLPEQSGEFSEELDCAEAYSGGACELELYTAEGERLPLELSNAYAPRSWTADNQLFMRYYLGDCGYYGSFWMLYDPATGQESNLWSVEAEMPCGAPEELGPQPESYSVCIRGACAEAVYEPQNQTVTFRRQDGPVFEVRKGVRSFEITEPQAGTEPNDLPRRLFFKLNGATQSLEL